MILVWRRMNDLNMYDINRLCDVFIKIDDVFILCIFYILYRIYKLIGMFYILLI